MLSRIGWPPRVGSIAALALGRGIAARVGIFAALADGRGAAVGARPAPAIAGRPSAPPLSTARGTSDGAGAGALGLAPPRVGSTAALLGRSSDGWVDCCGGTAYALIDSAACAALCCIRPLRCRSAALITGSASVDIAPNSIFALAIVDFIHPAPSPDSFVSAAAERGRLSLPRATPFHVGSGGATGGASVRSLYGLLPPSAFGAAIAVPARRVFCSGDRLRSGGETLR